MNATQDAFLGGRLHLWQPAKGYRAGVDPVLLAASVEAKAGETVLDLGCGTGAVGLCLATRVAVLVTGVERQPDYATLARRNADETGIVMPVVEADLSALPADLRQSSFNHVVMNPPYFLGEHGTQASDTGRAAAFSEETPLPHWIDIATRRLMPGGWLWLVQRADRLMDVLGAMDARLGSVSVRPVVPRRHRDASLVLVRARKGGRAATRLLSPLVMHQGHQYQGGEDYTPRVASVLRDGAALGWNDQGLDD